MKTENLLKLLLVACGLGCSAAAVAVLMPRDWMVRGHELLGMGPFPAQPIAEYLARLTSGMYALYGILVLLMATNVRRYAPLITVQALLVAAVAVVCGYFGWRAGIPRWWIVVDVGSSSGLAVAVWLLQYRLRAADRAAAGQKEGQDQ